MKQKAGLTKAEILKIFLNNFKYNHTSTPLGEGVVMPTRDAFLFCNVTGSAYLDNYSFPFTPKGLMKLFYNAMQYNLVTGIFENASLLYTPYYLSKKYDFVFNSEHKIIVPIEFESEKELQKLLSSTMPQLKQPTTDYIIMRVENFKEGHGLESFMEYLTAECFKKRGYIVENQIPLAHAVGSPDFGGYKLQQTLKATQQVLPNGFHIIELAMIRLDNKDNDNSYFPQKSFPYNLIVGEAKTSTKIMDAQLKKYLNTQLFDWGLEIHPTKKKPTNNDRGLLTLDDNYHIKFIPQTQTYVSDCDSPYSREKYIIWLENYMKFHLLANFTNDELKDFIRQKTGNCLISKQSLVDFVITISAEEIINRIKTL